MNYPKWKYRVDPIDKAFQSTLVANAEIDAELGSSWTDDPSGHGVEVVPFPAEITTGGTLIHNPTMADANGNHPYGPAPTAPGVNGTVIGRRLS